MTKAEKLEKVKEYRKARDQMKALEKQYRKIGEDVFAYEAKELFDANPDLIDFGWRQFTPAFNDGEPCTFCCYKDDPAVNGLSDDYGDETDGSTVYPTITEKRRTELCEAVGDFLDNYSKDDMHSLFGDCVKLTVNRKGITKDEYQPY